MLPALLEVLRSPLLLLDGWPLLERLRFHLEGNAEIRAEEERHDIIIHVVQGRHKK